VTVGRDHITPASIPLQTALDLPGAPQTEEARAASAAARCDAHALLASDARWLLGVLHQADATLIVAPGVVGYMLPGQEGMHDIVGLGAYIRPGQSDRMVPEQRARDPKRWGTSIDGALPITVVTYHRIDADAERLVPTAPRCAQQRAADMELQHQVCEALYVSGLLPLFRAARAVVLAMPDRWHYLLLGAPSEPIAFPSSWCTSAAGDLQ
jgi:hypothetical protein